MIVLILYIYSCAWNYLLIVFIEAISNKGRIAAVLYVGELNKLLKIVFLYTILKPFHYWKKSIWVFYNAFSLKGQSFSFFVKSFHLTGF